MVLEAEQYIRNEGFGGKFLPSGGSNNKPWTQAQLWKTIKLLVGAKGKPVPYDELLFTGIKSKVLYF